MIMAITTMSILIKTMRKSRLANYYQSALCIIIVNFFFFISINYPAPNIQNAYGNAALHIAAENHLHNRIDMLEQLLRLGADLTTDFGLDHSLSQEAYNYGHYNLNSPSLAAGTKPMGFPKGRSEALPFGRRRGTYPVDDINWL